MNEPRGALNIAHWRAQLKWHHPDRIIYLACPGMIRKARASAWMFNTYPPHYYFDNFWWAYAYALQGGGQVEVQAIEMEEVK